jgi:hypothetical protein
MSDNLKPSCPECAESFEAPEIVDRRNFIRVLGGGAAALATLGGATNRVLAAKMPRRKRPFAPPSRPKTWCASCTPACRPIRRKK